LKTGVSADGGIRQELRLHVAREIGPVAKPDDIRFAEALPKTRSGKIMRRLLKQIAAGGENQRRHHHAGGFQCFDQTGSGGGVMVTVSLSLNPNLNLNPLCSRGRD